MINSIGVLVLSSKIVPELRFEPRSLWILGPDNINLMISNWEKGERLKENLRSGRQQEAKRTFERAWC